MMGIVSRVLSAFSDVKKRVEEAEEKEHLRKIGDDKLIALGLQPKAVTQPLEDEDIKNPRGLFKTYLKMAQADGITEKKFYEMVESGVYVYGKDPRWLRLAQDAKIAYENKLAKRIHPEEELRICLKANKVFKTKKSGIRRSQ